MADGRIVEIGSHEELIRRPGGLYAYLWGLQTKSGGGRGMNEAARSIVPTGSPGPPAQPARSRRSRFAKRGEAQASDREFLAPVLEILETPASPVRVAFLWTICALVVAGLVLAYFGRIDIIASAQGKFQPTGRVKVIEPVETGRVVAVHVANDSAVKAGDTLIQLDPSAAEADAKEARADLAAAEAEAVRRREALAAARAGRYAPSRVVAWPEEVDQSLRAREERVLAADLGQLAATVASFDAQKTRRSQSATC